MKLLFPDTTWLSHNHQTVVELVEGAQVKHDKEKEKLRPRLKYAPWMLHHLHVSQVGLWSDGSSTYWFPHR
jgi:hypothetical protein